MAEVDDRMVVKTEDIYGKVKKYVSRHNMISDRDVILAGVSGGADSVCLLLMLWELSKEMDFKLLTVHVHHGVRKDADADADYVRELCRKLEIPFFIKRVDMEGYARKQGISSEEAGRKLRYMAFEEILEKTAEEDALKGESRALYKIAVAHNSNDKAETMLFNLFRGSGLRGLGSIRPVRENIIRPILCLERKEIEAYLTERKISFCIDSTNDEDNYTRNRIRHHILPFAEEQICANSTAHVSDAADILAEADAFIQKQTGLSYDRCVHSLGNASCENQEEELAINLSIFFSEDVFMQKMILLRCMEELTPHRKDITKEHIAALLRLCAKGGSGRLSFPYGLAAYKEYDRLVIYKEAHKPPYDMKVTEEYLPINVTVPGEVEVPGLGVLEFSCLKNEGFFCKKGQIIPEKTYTKWFDYDKITRVLVLRTRETGDYITIDTALKKKSVKEYMINEKIPRMRRDCIYLLAEGAHILWIPGYRISQYYKVDENTERILQVHLRGGK